VLAEVEKGHDSFESSKPIIADMRPHDDVMILKQYGRSKNLYGTTPFLKKELIKEMKSIAFTVKPDNYTSYDFKRYLYEAYHNAKIMYYESRLFIQKAQRTNKKRARMRMKKLYSIALS
jgi:hypothetical protein